MSYVPNPLSANYKASRIFDDFLSDYGPINGRVAGSGQVWSDGGFTGLVEVGDECMRLVSGDEWETAHSTLTDTTPVKNIGAKVQWNAGAGSAFYTAGVLIIAVGSLATEFFIHLTFNRFEARLEVYATGLGGGLTASANSPVLGAPLIIGNEYVFQGSIEGTSLIFVTPHGVLRLDDITCPDMFIADWEFAQSGIGGTAVSSATLTDHTTFLEVWANARNLNMANETVIGWSQTLQDLANGTALKLNQAFGSDYLGNGYANRILCPAGSTTVNFRTGLWGKDAAGVERLGLEVSSSDGWVDFVLGANGVKYRSGSDGSFALLTASMSHFGEFKCYSVKIGGFDGGSGTTMTIVRHGTATLVNGVIAVSDSTITANTRILVTRNGDGGTPGCSYSITRTASTSFTITSKRSDGTTTETSDTSTMAYLLIEP